MLTLLLGPRPGEFPPRAPGAIEGAEIVSVFVRAAGAIDGIDVDQTLTLHGTGDFSLEISGPAIAVKGDPGASTRPGMRRGSVVWDGFVPGTRTVHAVISLDPKGVRFTPLPYSVSIVNGVCSMYGSRKKMPVARIANETEVVRPYDGGLPDPAALGDLLDRIRASLRAGRAPVAGRGGIPATLTSSVPVTSETTGVRAAFDVTASMGGAPVMQTGTAPIEVHGPGPFQMQARPGLPSPDEVAPPGEARTWREGLANARPVDLRAALALAQRILWSSLRRVEYEAFLGNPLGGASSARYVYAPAAAAPGARPAAPKEKPKPVPIAIVLVALAVAGARWWLTH